MGRPPLIRRQELLETARQVFAAKGFQAATLADIAAELNVTAAAVLRHFPSKQELFANAMRPHRVSVPEFILELANVDPASDPRVVLRRVAEQFVPFVQKTLAENLAVYMHSRAQTSIVLPFDPRDPDTPPRRGLQVVTEYFRRAQSAGVVSVRDPRAAALLFMGSLQSYVFLHQVLHVTPVYPLPDYIDALIDLWVHGAIGGFSGRRKTKHAQETRPADRDRGSGSRRAAVSARGAKAARAAVLRNAGSKNRKRRVAVRRPRRNNPDR